MSKFHDEFFKTGSPKHDKLMIKSLSKEGIARILDAVNIKQVVSDKLHERAYSTKFTACVMADSISLFPGWENDGHPNYYDGPRKMIHGGCTYDDDDMCKGFKNGKCLHQLQQVTASNIWFDDFKESYTYETEVIAKNGHFIIGYADAIIRSKFVGDVMVDISELKTSCQYRRFEVLIDTLVEAKPDLTSIGDVLRQLKTYKQFLQVIPHREPEIPMNMVITTYSTPDQDTIDYLEHEGVKVITFPS